LVTNIINKISPKHETVGWIRAVYFALEKKPNTEEVLND